MVKVISLLFLTLLFSGCNSDKGSDDKPIPPVEVEYKNEPVKIQYNFVNASYYRDVPIQNNIPSITGKNPSIPFDLNGADFTIEPVLPAGLAFDIHTGVISGTPTSLVAQSFFTIKLKNEFGIVSTGISIKVVIPPPENLRYTWSTSGHDLTNHEQIPLQIPTVNGLVNSYCMSPSLPNGMTFDTTTGEIGGKPVISDITALGRYITYTVRSFNTTCPNTNNACTNNCGSNTYSFKLRFIELPPENLSYTLSSPVYNVGVPIAPNCPETGGGYSEDYKIEPHQNNLPPGLFFNITNGCITGTPLAEVANPLSFVVTSTNTGGSTNASINFRVFSAPPITVSYQQNNVDYTKGSIVQNKLNHTGGKPTVFSLNKPLPQGLTINPHSGAIEGTPTELMVRTEFVLTASNTGGSAQHSFSIGVKDIAPANINYGQSSFSFRNREPISLLPRGNTGGEVITYSITPSLPQGLQINTSTGEIFGTPQNEQVSRVYTVMASNTGGSYNFQYSLTITPVPNYDFSYKLISKEFVPPSSIHYTFEIENRSRESDNSVGVNLSMPFSVEYQTSALSTINSVDSNCFNLSLFTYLQKCKIKISINESMIDSSTNIAANLKAASVLSKIIDMRPLTDISPKNVILSGDRGRIVKAIYNGNEIEVNTTEPAPLEKIGEATIPLVSTEIQTSGGSSKDYNSQINIQRDLVDGIDSIVPYRMDPDVDGIDGVNLYNNVQFTINLLVTANMNGYAPRCQINPPYVIPGGCILGSFSIGGANLSETGTLSVKIGTQEGLPQEFTNSNTINVDVYSVKKIISYFMTLSNNSSGVLELKKNLIVHNNKIFTSGLTNPEGENSTTNKLLSFDPTYREVKQISSFSSNGDDFAKPLTSYEGLLFFEARTPSNIDGSNPFAMYVYDEIQSKINPLYTMRKYTPSNSTEMAMVRKANNSDEAWSFIHNNRLYFNSQIFDSEADSYYSSVLSYSKISNTIRKEINKAPGNVSVDLGSGVYYDSNGKVDAQSIVYSSSENKFYFNAFYKSVAPVNGTDPHKYFGGFKLHSYDLSNRNQKLISRKNDPLVSDYLEQVNMYDSKLFFISKTPLKEGVGVNTKFTLSDNLLKSELVMYNTDTQQFKTIFESPVNGSGSIFGVHYGKLFFSMPSSANKYGLYVYDAITQSVSKLFETATGDKIFKINRYTNLSNTAGFYFAMAPTNSSSKNIMLLKQNGNDFLVDMVVSRNSVYVDEDTTMFTYNNTVFFSCEEGTSVKLNSICAYSDQEKTLSLILKNVAPVSNPVQIPGQRNSSLILLNNRIYFTGFAYNPSSNKVEFGMFEMCIQTDTGCSL